MFILCPNPHFLHNQCLISTHGWQWCVAWNAFAWCPFDEGRAPPQQHRRHDSGELQAWLVPKSELSSTKGVVTARSASVSTPTWLRKAATFWVTKAPMLANFCLLFLVQIHLHKHQSYSDCLQGLILSQQMILFNSTCSKTKVPGQLTCMFRSALDSESTHNESPDCVFDLLCSLNFLARQLPQAKKQNPNWHIFWQEGLPTFFSCV